MWPNVEVTGAARLYRAASVWTAGLAYMHGKRWKYRCSFRFQLVLCKNHSCNVKAVFLAFFVERTTHQFECISVPLDVIQPRAVAIVAQHNIFNASRPTLNGMPVIGIFYSGDNLDLLPDVKFALGAAAFQA